MLFADGAAKMDILVAYDRICEVKPDISADKLGMRK